MPPEVSAVLTAQLPPPSDAATPVPMPVERVEFHQPLADNSARTLAAAVRQVQEDSNRALSLAIGAAPVPEVLNRKRKTGE